MCRRPIVERSKVVRGKLWAVIAGTLIRKRVGARSEGRRVTAHFTTRRSSENMLVIIVFFSWAVHGSSAARRIDHMANPYSSLSCAPFYCLLVGELWLRGLGVFWGGSHSSSWCGLGRGGSTSGPPNLAAGGRAWFGPAPNWATPEVAGGATPDCAAGLRDSGYQSGLGREWSVAWSQHDPTIDAH